MQRNRSVVIYLCARYILSEAHSTKVDANHFSMEANSVSGKP